MKKLVCLGFMAVVLGVRAQNDPPTNVFGTATGDCTVVGQCQYGVYYVTVGSFLYCVPGTQPSCQQTSCAYKPSQPYSC
jgi:hypothetical protein